MVKGNIGLAFIVLFLSVITLQFVPATPFYKEKEIRKSVPLLIKPIIKNKGSAIFIHVAKKSFKKTEGCIALNKKNLINLLSIIKKNTKI